MEIKFIATLIIAFLNIFLGVFIIRKNSKSPANISYGGMCITGGLWALSMAWLLIEKNFFIVENFIIKGTYIFGITPPLFYLLFAYYFPYKLKVYSKLFLNLICLFPIVFILLILFGFIQMEQTFVVNNKIIQQSVYPDFLIFAVYFFSYIVWGFTLLLKKLSKDAGIYKSQIKYLIFATISTFIFTGTVSVILPLVWSFAYDWLGPIFTLIHFIIAGYLVFIKPLKIIKE